MLSNVEYERSEGQYRVSNPITGEEEFFPSGYRGRREALHRAVYFQNARLHRLVTQLVKKWPQVESRAWRAAELVIQGAVKEPPNSQALFAVTSSTEYGDYLIASRKGLIICDCMDYMDGNAPYLGERGQRICKHILAAQFARLLQSCQCGSCGQTVDAELMVCPFCSGPVDPF